MLVNGKEISIDGSTLEQVGNMLRSALDGSELGIVLTIEEQKILAGVLGLSIGAGLAELIGGKPKYTYADGVFQTTPY